jgi:hypothetical protein
MTCDKSMTLIPSSGMNFSCIGCPSFPSLAALNARVGAFGASTIPAKIPEPFESLTHHLRDAIAQRNPRPYISVGHPTVRHTQRERRVRAARGIPA